MRKRSILSGEIIGKPIEEANYADVCFYDKEKDNKVIVDPSEINTTDYPIERFTPIGIVVIPSSHTDNGRPKIVSLDNMDNTNPDNGTNQDRLIRWGFENENIPNLVYRNQLPCLSELTENGVLNYTSSYVYLPMDFSGFYENPLNSNEGFYDNTPSMCSPYKEDGTKELRYFDTSNSNNALSDFDGKDNTEKVISYVNSKSTDWQTANEIEDFGEYCLAPFKCCWRYHTEGTNQGEWYVPSANELGYLITRQFSIKDTQDLLYRIYDRFCAELRGVDVWSSTQYDERSAIAFTYNVGVVSPYEKLENDDKVVRAFLQI